MGAHVESLQDYIMNTRQGHDENNVPFDWPICDAGSCTTTGLGNCNGWCMGGSCKGESRPNPDPNAGVDSEVGTGTKNYTITLSYNL